MTSAFNDGAGNDGALSGFALNGNTSNWVARGRDILPRCTVAPFAYREGNSGENIPEHAKVYDGDIFTSGVEIINNENFPSFSRRRADGSIVWRTRINVKSYISDFIRTDEGCYLLVGNTPNFTSNSKSFIARIDQTGVLDFHHVYNLGNRESFSRIIRSTNPSNPLFPYTVSGINNNSGVLDENILLFTVDNQGAIGWMRQIGYTGTNLTDGRTDLTNGFGNPDIGAVMYNFEMDPDSCPVMREVPNVKDFTLVPTDLSTLPNIFLTPPPPQISNPWIHYTLGRDSICKSDCACSFSKMSFSKKGTTWHPSVSCGNLPPIPVLCPGQYAYNALKFSGKLNCKGSCSFTSLSWTIKNPNNVIVSTGSSSSAVFLISITLPMVQTPGVYTIQLTGKCGTNVCECTIKFQVGDCPKPCDCNEPGFSNAVNTGFYWTIMSDCKVKFTPKSLTDCDAFLWQVAKSGSTNFVTFANSTANQPVIY